MKKTTLAVLAALAMTLLPATSALGQEDPVYTFDGAGWGHGVGMSQYGARAMALSGMSANEILTTYYQGVTVEPIDDVLSPSHWLLAEEDPLWIGIAQNQTSVKFHLHTGSAGLCKANDGEGECPTQTALPGGTYEFRALGGGACQFFLDDAPLGNPGTCRGEITWDDQPVTQVHLDDHGDYARGTIKFRPAGAGFHIILKLGIDEYIYGLGEMPSEWHSEALKAQAIAGRTYGIRQSLRFGPEPSFSSSRRASCWCHLVDTTADQAYVGWYKENEPKDQRWVDAVNATSGEIITHPEAPESTVIIAYYSSSSGGHTDSNVDGFGHSSLLPYLQGIDDPWSVDPIAQNPLDSWSKKVSASTIAAAVGLDVVTGVAVTSRHVSDSVDQVAISGILGGADVTITRTGASFKRAIGLRSAYYTVTSPPGALVPSPGPGLCEDPTPPDAGFGDVSQGSVHKGDIDCVAYLGVIPGESTTSFGPTGEIRRSDMALFMIRTAEWLGIELPDPDDQGFDDIDGLTREERDAVNRMAALGLTKGTGPATYSPDWTVDRWQMAIFLIRLHALAGYEPPLAANGFTDIGSHPAETVRSIGQLFNLGVTNGCAVSPARYCPERDVTREQMSSFLARLIRLDS